ncbi:MAG TPA: FecR family protein [Burkholderiales bacterium]
MLNQTFKLNGRALLLGLIAAAYPVIGHAAPAARVDFATGNVKAVGPNGQSRTLAKGAQIEQGETISTNNGRAQLRFTDGAYVSLQPESEFRIDQYRFDGKQDGNEKGFFSLVKGGLRTITGLVGRSNKNNYQVTTSVATIGIRGTEYTIQYGQSIVGTVGEGEINVCNGAGCLSVTNGESYYVQSDAVKPVLTNKRTDLPPPSPQNPPSSFAEGETVNEAGDPCALFPETCRIEPPLTKILTGTIIANLATVDNCDGPCESLFTQTTATLDSAGVLTSFGTSFPQVFSSASSGGNDGIIAWGSASASSGGEIGTTDFVHYVVGLPVDNIAALGGMTGTYSLISPTNIIGLDGVTVVGALKNMTMQADFSSGFNSVSIQMGMTLGSFNRTVCGFGCGGAESFSFFASQSVNSGSVNVSGNGFFAGTNAVRAGFVYDVNESSLDQNVEGMGVGALKQDSLELVPPAQ